MRPWHESFLSEKELNESFSDSMKEDGLDPDNDDDRRLQIDRANREAFEEGNRDAMIEEFDWESGKSYPER